MKLYMHPVSATSRPVRMFIKHEKIPMEEVVIDLMKGEHYGPVFTAINPNRQVPVLDDEGFVMAESSAILKYLADKTKSALYPADLKQRARINERMDWFNTSFYREWGYSMIYPQVFPHHARPSDEITQGTINWGKDKSNVTLEILDKSILGDNPYVCGDKLTIADVFGGQLLATGELIRCDLGKFPKVRAWLDRLKALPAWNETNDVHDGFAASLASKAFIAV